MVTSAREFTVSTFGSSYEAVLDVMDKKYPGSADRQVEWKDQDLLEYKKLAQEFQGILINNADKVKEASKLYSEKDDDAWDIYKTKGFDYTVDDVRNSSPYWNALCDIPGVEQQVQKMIAFELAHSEQFGKTLGIAG